jgi:TonB-linked SusC/RagA family outer membrane protein
MKQKLTSGVIIFFTGLILAMYGNAQQVIEPIINSTLNGKILDTRTRSPLPGAVVQIKGTTHEVIADKEGNFSFKTGQKFPYILVVSHVGYETVERTANENTITISISEQPKGLDEVIVVGYGTKDRRSLIGSVSKVKANEVTQIPVASLDAQLQGKAAGVLVNSQSGIPGQSVVVRVRGATSLNATNDPLYVIDGVFINNTLLSTLDLGGKSNSPLADINPADIESIEILKDASATAIYGSRGANGVVLITTKRGNYNSPARVNFNVTQGLAWAQKSRLWDLTTGPEHATLVNEQWINSGIDKPSLNQNFANRPFRPVSEGGRGLPEEQQTYDRISDLFRTGRLQNYDISLEGGNKSTRYYLGGSYTKQEANIRPAYYERASFKINLDQKVNNNITVGSSSTVSWSKRNEVRAGTGPQGGIFQAGLHTPTYLPKLNADGTPAKWAGFDNLQVLIEQPRINSISLRYIGNVFADAEIIKGLNFRSSWSIDFNNYDEDEYNNDITQIGAATSGLAISAITQNTSWINEQTLTYKTNIGSRHSLRALVGNTIQSNELKFNRAQGTGFPNNSYTQISAAATRTATQSWTKSTLASFFSRVDYNYDSKYYLEFSIRADGSSRFGDNNKWGYFPSVGAAWRLKEESFLSNEEWLNDLKIRASYGFIGNQNGINDFAAQGLWTGGAGYPDNTSGGDKPGTAPLQLGNPNLRWEKTRQFDAGIDLSVLNGRLNISADIYHKYTTDLLIPRQVQAVSGFSTFTTNEGEISNKGIELNINSLNINKKDFTWRTNFNISANRNKIEKLPTPSVYGSRDMIRAQEGYPLYSFWLYKQLYVDQQTGAAVFEDVNKDGNITVADRQIMGNATPDFFGGITNSISYKGFDFSIFFTYQYGNEVVSFDRILGEGGGVKDANRMIFAYNLKRWQNPGDITDVPRATSVGNNYLIEQNSRFLEDASFLRLKNVTIGYSLPQQVLSRIKVSSLRVYVMGGNLWLLTNYIGPDPEATHTSDQNARGIDVGTPPQPQTFQFGVQLSL